MAELSRFPPRNTTVGIIGFPGTKKVPGSDFSEPGINLATTYSHRTYRPTTIGAAAFHFRVRNGTGWFHRAVVTRGQSRMIGTGTLAALFTARPLSDIHTEKDSC